MERKTYDIFDLTKFILSIGVVAIHCELFPYVLFPWLRVAVPLFFMISSFLFFSGNGSLKKYIKRNLTLYFVWFIILLPFTIYERQSWFSEGIIRGIFRSMRGFLMGSTFRGSWFIMAGVIAMSIIFLASRRMKMQVLFLVTMAMYGCCWLSANSHFALGNIQSSFLFACIWIVIGKAYAERKIAFTKKLTIIGIIISVILLYVEHCIVVYIMAGSRMSSCYFMLIPLCMFLFQGILYCNGLQVEKAKALRNSSTIIYVSHCAVLLCVSWALKKVCGIDSPFMEFGVTVAIVIMTSYICIRLSEFSKLQFLKKLW